MTKYTNLFDEWCNERGKPCKIDRASCQAFGAYLRKEHTAAFAKVEMKKLYEAGVSGTDLDVRDFLFANFRDGRSINEILAAPWWPNIPRVLVAQLHVPDRRRVVVELDNFFRWQQRVGQIQSGDVLNTLFLSVSLKPKARYRKLSTLCRSLEIALPGDPDLIVLRELQRDLYRELWPAARSTKKAARRILEVEAVLELHRKERAKKPLSDETIMGHRRALTLHFDLLAAKGMPFDFEEAALDVYADHVWGMHDLRYQPRNASSPPDVAFGSPEGWCSISAGSMCQRLGPFIADPELRREWYAFADSFLTISRTIGDIKRKERALAERPMDLNDLYLKASELHRLARQEVDVQVRHGLCTVVGSLGIFLFYPLRIGDVLKLRLGFDLTRSSGVWLLDPGRTQKSGNLVDPIILPREATPLLDACLLQGAQRAKLSEILQSKSGSFMFQSRRRSGAYRRSSFSTLFKRWLEHSPHVIRTLWCDQMVALGTDRTTIGAMLQHKSEISQHDYEVIARNIRRVRALSALSELGENRG
jgi:hypothetical protein